VSAAIDLYQKISSKFFKVLANPSESERKDAYASFATNIAEMMEKVKEGGFYESGTLTIVDIVVIPTLLRIFMLDHYRPTLKLDEFMSEVCLQKFHSYVGRVKELPAVQKTLWKDDKGMIDLCKKFVL
jgi:glutathione S-transferase